MCPDTASGPADRTLAVVGGGFSGTMLAVHLLREARAPLHVVVFERRGAPGRGVAYGTRQASHLLNVRSAGMSAFPEDPDHFVRWARGPGALPESAPADFLPRHLYGGYLEHLLAEARAAAPPGCTLVVAREEVLDIEVDGDAALVRLASGTGVRARAVALALGNLPGHGPFPGASLPGYVGNPWDPAAWRGISREAPVLVIGTGLTMVDLYLSLRGEGHRGVVHALSRRGLLPLAHVPGQPGPPVPVDPGSVPPRVAAWLRLLRRRSREKGDWRLVVDGLRSHATGIWRSFPPAERARFLRHARPYWDVHRHRTAPSVAREVATALEGGGLVVHAGRIRDLAPGPLGLRARVSPRGGGAPFDLDAERVVNATGPETDPSRIEDPLVQALLLRGAVRPDAHRLGLDASPEGAVLHADGRTSRVLFTLGPLLRGILWECTAVPEIRVQARDLARCWLRLLADGD